MIYFSFFLNFSDFLASFFSLSDSSFAFLASSFIIFNLSLFLLSSSFSRAFFSSFARRSDSFLAPLSEINRVRPNPIDVAVVVRGRTAESTVEEEEAVSGSVVDGTSNPFPFPLTSRSFSLSLESECSAPSTIGENPATGLFREFLLDFFLERKLNLPLFDDALSRDVFDVRRVSRIAGAETGGRKPDWESDVLEEESSSSIV